MMRLIMGGREKRGENERGRMWKESESERKEKMEIKIERQREWESK